MNHPESDLQDALYFRLAIESGLLEWRWAKDWAYALIEARELPQCTIIEVATVQNRRQMIDELAEFARPQETGPVLGRLFGVILEGLTTDRLDAERALAHAKYLSRAMPERDEAEYAFEHIDDDFWLVQSGVYTFEEVRANLIDELGKWAVHSLPDHTGHDSHTA